MPKTEDLLYKYCYCENVEKVGKILDTPNINPDQVNSKSKKTPLQVAIEKNNKSIVNLLLKKIVSTHGGDPSRHGQRPLVLAVSNGLIYIANPILENGNCVKGCISLSENKLESRSDVCKRGKPRVWCKIQCSSICNNCMEEAIKASQARKRQDETKIDENNIRSIYHILLQYFNGFIPHTCQNIVVGQ